MNWLDASTMYMRSLSPTSPLSLYLRDSCMSSMLTAASATILVITISWSFRANGETPERVEVDGSQHGRFAAQSGFNSGTASSSKRRRDESFVGERDISESDRDGVVSGRSP